ncbi:MAG: GNAT family N-acetyltransferase [Pseudomonadota bacterium]|nr:GNAT family N-acetyltransferase [Pseudomonadota bacterium]
MAEIYAAAFATGRAWSALEIAELIGGAGGFAVYREAGFAIGRAIAGEAELITLAVRPEARRKGEGRALLSAFEVAARARAAETMFLEVAADNAAAYSLYQATGWVETGRRKGYYPRQHGPAVDAILMTKPLV